MEKLKYIQLAVSKDKTRFNLTSPYRDTDKIVATCGHRLHWVDAPKQESKGYLDPSIDAEFPDYTQVMPKGEPTGMITASLDKKDYLALKAMRDIAKLDGHFCSAVLLLGNGQVSIEVASVAVCKMLLVGAACDRDDSVRIGVNLSYFLDAISPVFSGKEGQVTIKLDGELGPMLFETKTLDGTYHAVIMPLRLPENKGKSWEEARA